MSKRVALLTNIVAPYQVPVYNRLAEHFNLLILTSGHESNREEWGEVTSRVNAEVRQAWGYTFEQRRQSEEGVFDFGYVHVNPGYVKDLIAFNPDAVISHEMGVRSMIALAYGRLTGTPTWIYWEGTTRTERAIGPVRKTIREVFARVTRHWFAIGQDSTEYLASLGVSPSRVTQIQYCVDEEKLNGDRVNGKSLFDQRPALLYVGQLIDRKGIPQLLQGVREVKQDGRDVDLYLVGGGPQEETYKRQVRDLGLSERVHFLGAYPPDDVAQFYRAADAFVLPSLQDGWGLVVSEAIWCGCPVLSSIYAGVTSEVVPEGNRFDPLDRDDVRRGLLKALEGDLDEVPRDRLMRNTEVADAMAAPILDQIGTSDDVSMSR
jgi:glycosyltransferase involved in cell wall biosynthesis